MRFGFVFAILAFLVLTGSPLAVAVTDTNVVSITCSISAAISVSNPGSAIDVATFGTQYTTTGSYTLTSLGGGSITAVVQTRTGTHTGHTFTIRSTTTPSGSNTAQKNLISNGTNQASQTVVTATDSGSYTGGVFTYGSTIANGGDTAGKTVTVLYTLSG